MEPVQNDTSIDKVLAEKWYYTVELRPGEFTKGFSFKNIAASRTVLDAVDVQGQRVLDISTMEGMFSVLMARRGATVVATDAINHEERIRLLKRTYGVAFDYRPNTPVQNYVDQMFLLQATRSFTSSRPLLSEPVGNPYGYDIVFSSGLIYHVLNPVDHLLNYRRLCKTNGLCIVESAVLLSDKVEMIHDWQGDVQMFGGNATWFVSTRALEVYLKACFFKPLGFAYVRSTGKGGLPLARIAVVARAVTERPFSVEEVAVIKGSELFKNFDFAPLYASSQLTGSCTKVPTVHTNRLHSADDLRGSTVGRFEEVAFTEQTLRLSLVDH